MARTTRPPKVKPSPAQAFAASLGMTPPPAVVQFTLCFSAPRQGAYQPPDYELVIDSTRADWCTYRNYNAAPRPIAIAQVQVPVEMNSFVVRVQSKGIKRAKVEAWARALLARVG